MTVTLGVLVDRRYDPNLDLYCFAGELRQVLSNFVSNAMDAMAGGGRLLVSARRSRDWVHPERDGVRITIADTGSGMTPPGGTRVPSALRHADSLSPDASEPTPGGLALASLPGGCSTRVQA